MNAVLAVLVASPFSEEVDEEVQIMEKTFN